MRGSPLLRATLVLAVLLALAVPLRRVTQPERTGVIQPTTMPQTVSPDSVQAQKLSLVLSFTREAEHIELRHLGKPIWTKERPSLRETVELNLPFPQEGIELGVAVRWPEEALSALRLQLTTPDGTELERSAWGAGTMEAIVSFP